MTVYCSSYEEQVTPTKANARGAKAAPKPTRSSAKRVAEESEDEEETSDNAG